MGNMVIGKAESVFRSELVLIPILYSLCFPVDPAINSAMRPELVALRTLPAEAKLQRRLAVN